jgi:eukaryotic-like serine/threonine-protein kinase
MTSTPSASEGAAAIAELEAAGQLQDAAQRAQAAGLHERAASLYERACLFDRAAASAIDAGQTQRGVLLAALGADDAVMQRAMQAAVREPAAARSAASLLLARGQPLVAARVLQSIGEMRQAARAWELAGDGVAAARALQSVGDVREAARVLQAALGASPTDEAVMLELGTLLARAARHDAALRVLQRIPDSSPLHSRALPHLIASLDALGLTVPRDSLMRQARASGLSPVAADSPERPQGSPELMFGRFQKVRVAACTSSARVLEAVDQLSGRRVAIKQLLGGQLGAGRDAFARLVREARALSQLRAAHVVPLVELIEEAAVIVTPWMSGGSLSDLMKRQRLVPSRAVEIACAVLGALGEAHRLGIVHRDVKPSNILFDESGTPRLADFGVAHLSDCSATATAGVIGTWDYMSPEQRQGQPATPASDVYSTGVTLVEMLTGHAPSGWQTEQRPSMHNADLSPEHDRVVLAMIDPLAEQRPQGALKAREGLLKLRWPCSLPAAAQSLPAPAPVAVERGCSRLTASGPDVLQDSWLARTVHVTALDEPHMRIAKAYASAPGDGLSAVLRLDSEGGQIWFDAPQGDRWSDTGGWLSAAQLDRIAAVLRHLQQHGVAHGAVDAQHIRIIGDWVQLVFEPSTALSAKADQDRSALARLAETGPER